MITFTTAIILTLISSFVSAFGSLFLKKGSVDFKLRKLGVMIRNKSLVFGIFLYIIGALLFIVALRGGKVSVLFPFGASVTYIWVSLLSIKYLNENMNLYKWLGIAVIIIGIVFIVQ